VSETSLCKTIRYKSGAKNEKQTSVRTGGAVVGGAFALFIYTGGAYKRDALACSTEFNFTRNEGKAMK
jgi:hypothetical protein